MNRRDKPYLELGARIRDLRLAARLKQTEVAALAGLGHAYPSAIERGVHRPEPPVLHRLIRVFADHGAPVGYDELAALAGYASEPPALLLPVDDEAKVPVVRRLLHYPLAALLALEDIAIRLHMERYEEPEPRADLVPEHH